MGTFVVMNDCLFCKIGKKEIPAAVVHENDHVVAFLDIHPVAPGHTMIIPKVHAENMLDLPDEEVEHVFKAVKHVTGMLKRALSPDAFTIGINHGRMSGQMVDHLHVHVLPRFENDGGGSIHSVVQNAPNESLEDIKDKIIQANK
jgi:histidine triad (HIT) family protein